MPVCTYVRVTTYIQKTNYGGGDERSYFFGDIVVGNLGVEGIGPLGILDIEAKEKERMR